MALLPACQYLQPSQHTSTPRAVLSTRKQKQLYSFSNPCVKCGTATTTVTRIFSLREQGRPNLTHRRTVCCNCFNVKPSINELLSWVKKGSPPVRTRFLYPCGRSEPQPFCRVLSYDTQRQNAYKTKQRSVCTICIAHESRFARAWPGFRARKPFRLATEIDNMDAKNGSQLARHDTNKGGPRLVQVTAHPPSHCNRQAQRLTTPSCFSCQQPDNLNLLTIISTSPIKQFLYILAVLRQGLCPRLPRCESRGESWPLR